MYHETYPRRILGDEMTEFGVEVMSQTSQCSVRNQEIELQESRPRTAFTWTRATFGIALLRSSGARQ